MAHLRDLGSKCQSCNRVAVVELFNTVNASFGKFCLPCGQLAKKRLQAEEDKHHGR